MAVLVSTKVKGQTHAGYDGLLSMVKDSIQKAPGFIMHCAFPAEEEWQLYEVWESKKQADEWFGTVVVPNLPEGLHPKRSYQSLHSMVKPGN